MSTLQTFGLIVVIFLGILAVLAYASTWAEPQDYDPVPPEKDFVMPDIDVERL